MNETDIAYSMDYLPAKMLGIAIVLEQRFMDIVDACPEDDKGMKCVLDEETLNRLLDCRLPSIMMSLSALDAYLTYYGYAYSTEIENSDLGRSKFKDHIDMPRMVGELEHASSKFLSMHEAMLTIHGAKTLVQFLRTPLKEMDKIFYFPLIKTRNLPNLSDPTVKTLLQLYDLRNEILCPDYSGVGAIHELPLRSREAGEITLTYSHPDGSSCAHDERSLKEFYAENNFIWEILHCAPPQTAQDFVRYVHALDESPVHFIAFMHAQRVRNGDGKPMTEKRPCFEIKTR